MALPEIPGVPGPYFWEYVDVQSGPFTAVAIFMVGSPFSADYAARHHQVPASAHSAVNFAVYQHGRRRLWVLSEYSGCQSDGRTLRIGRSSFTRHEDGRVEVEIDDREAPRGGPVRARLTLRPRAPLGEEVELVPGAGHYWRPVAIRGEATVELYASVMASEVEPSAGPSWAFDSGLRPPLRPNGPGKAPVMASEVEPSAAPSWAFDSALRAPLRPNGETPVMASDVEPSAMRPPQRPHGGVTERFGGAGYHDQNRGLVPLGIGVRGWTWERQHRRGSTEVRYRLHAGDVRAVATDTEVAITRVAIPPEPLRRTAWGLNVPRRAALLESSPFYARLSSGGESERLCEVADFARFQSPLIRWMARQRSRVEAP